MVVTAGTPRSCLSTPNIFICFVKLQHTRCILDRGLRKATALILLVPSPAWVVHKAVHQLAFLIWMFLTAGWFHRFPKVYQLALLLDSTGKNFAHPLLLVRAKLVFIEIRYKYLGYQASEASPFYTTLPTPSGLCIPQQALRAGTRFQSLTGGKVDYAATRRYIRTGKHATKRTT